MQKKTHPKQFLSLLVAVTACIVLAACQPIAPNVELSASPTEILAENETPSAKAISIDSGRFASCVVFDDGDVKCWGFNLDGQLGGGDFYRTAALKNVLGLEARVASVGVGDHSCVMTREGGVQCWGPNEGGELGNGTTEPSLTPVTPVGLESGVKMLTVSHDHNCVLLESGGVQCWGFNGNGRIGIGTRGEQIKVPTNVVGLDSGVVSIDAGKFHTCAILEGGAVKCWGENTNGQVGNDTTTMQLLPVDVVGLDEPIKQISGGGPFTCALTEAGGVMCWGANDFGQLGNGANANSLIPVTVVGLQSGVLKVSSSYNEEHDPARGDAIGGHACALLADGGVVCWGDNGSGELGDGTTESSNVPVEVQGLLGPAVDISTGGYFSCALITSGEIQCWGNNQFFQLSGDANAYSTTPIASQGYDPDIVMADGGEDFTCVAFSSERMQCVGFNWDGELGDGTDIDRSTPVNVTQLADAQSFAAGHNHTCTIGENGIVRCWGYNGFGQLGVHPDVMEWTARPGRVSSIAGGAVSISAAGHHTCALMEGGQVLCWGRNNSGQLGVGDSEDRDIATPVTGLEAGAVSVTLGVHHGCAALETGEVYCWGDNSRGQVGGTEMQSLSPTPISNLVGAIAVVASYYSTCALDAEGTVTCWGAGGRGQLGNGVLGDSSTPVKVQGLMGATQLAAGVDHLCALTSEGTVFCWGGNERGELGNGSTVDSSTPVQVAGLDDVVSIGAGSWHTCAVKSDGTLHCWGDSFFGKLGDGRQEQLNFPIPVTVSGIDAIE